VLARDTYVCACFARPLSNGVGSNEFCRRLFRTPTTSTPEYEAELESKSPLAELKVSPPEERLPAVVLASEYSGGEPGTRDTGYKLAGAGALEGMCIAAAG